MNFFSHSKISKKFECEKILYPLFGCLIPHSSFYQDAKDYAKGIIIQNMPSIENCGQPDDEFGTYTCDVNFINGFTEQFSFHEGVTERYVQDLLIKYIGFNFLC